MTDTPTDPAQELMRAVYDREKRIHELTDALRELLEATTGEDAYPHGMDFRALVRRCEALVR